MDRVGTKNEELKEQQKPREFLRFLAAGGIAAIANFCSRVLMSRWMTFTPAVVLAYLVGLATAFVLMRRFVFRRSDKPMYMQVAWFITVNLAAMAQTVLVSLLLADFVLPYLAIHWHTYEIAHAVGIIAPVFTSYIGHKRLSFSHK